MTIRIVENLEALMEVKDPAIRVVKHEGLSHADDVCAVAMISAVEGKDVYVLRTRDRKVLEEALQDGGTFVLDVGGEFNPDLLNFDHHFKPVPTNGDGEVLSSFGMVCDYLKVERCDFVRHVDAVDNGSRDHDCPQWWPILPTDRDKPSVAWVVHNSAPAHVDGSPVTKEEFDQRFADMANHMAQLFSWDGSVVGPSILQNPAEWVKQWCLWIANNEEAKKASVVRVESALEGKEGALLVLDQFEGGAFDVVAALPESHPIRFLVFPGTSGWMVQQVAVAPGSFQGRKQLPEAWAGLRDEAFQDATGVSDGIFCHPGRFVCGAKSREGAVRLAQMAVEA